MVWGLLQLSPRLPAQEIANLALYLASDEATTRRRRSIAPAKPKPPIIRAQAAGSGTAPDWTVYWKFAPKRPFVVVASITFGNVKPLPLLRADPRKVMLGPITRPETLLI